MKEEEEILLRLSEVGGFGDQSVFGFWILFPEAKLPNGRVWIQGVVCQSCVL